MVLCCWMLERVEKLGHERFAAAAPRDLLAVAAKTLAMVSSEPKSRTSIWVVSMVLRWWICARLHCSRRHDAEAEAGYELEAAEASVQEETKHGRRAWPSGDDDRWRSCVIACSSLPVESEAKGACL